MRLPKRVLLVATVLLAGGVASEKGGEGGPTPGEVLSYEIRWGFVKAGTSTLSILGRASCGDRRCWVLESAARSSGPISLVFPVRDRIVSHWDPLTGRTHWGRKELNEGRYHRIAEVWFSPLGRSATWREREFSGNTDRAGVPRKDARWRERSGRADNLPDPVVDMLSAVYYARLHPQRGRPGTSFELPVFDDGRLVRMRMDIVSREELSLRVNGRERRFRTIVVRPNIRTSGIFRARGETRIWISDDAGRWPLLVKAKIRLGSITAQLTSVGISRP